MDLFKAIKARQWPTVLGFFMFAGMMAVGYAYNVTFVQLGLHDLGTRVLGMSRDRVALDMALLAVITCVVALGVGLLMRRLGWGAAFRTKLRLAFGVLVVQTALTAAVPLVRSEPHFVAWIVVCSLALGVGVPVMFSMAVDLVPMRDRGYAAALITAAAYFGAEMLPGGWTVEGFRAQFLWLMLGGTASMAVVAFVRNPLTDWLVEPLARQHTLPAFGVGRFVRVGPDGQPHVRRRLVVFIALMFGVFFVDSLGFLRIIATPLYVESAWQSPDSGVRLVIAVTHVVAALIGGVLYRYLDERNLFLWVFGLFGMVHLMYTFEGPLAIGTPPLGTPILYATAVSLYTVLNFALWADVSTPQTISLNVALGVALSGWTATFISTALALRWETAGMPLAEHLRLVDALAMVFFLLMLALIVIPGWDVRTRRRTTRGEA